MGPGWCGGRIELRLTALGEDAPAVTSEGTEAHGNAVVTLEAGSSCGPSSLDEEPRAVPFRSQRSAFSRRDSQSGVVNGGRGKGGAAAGPASEPPRGRSRNRHLQGGSLSHIREHARTTYSIDIDPAVKGQLEPRMPNVRFLTGDSRLMVPTVLAECRASGVPLTFALVDGDHRYQAVKADLNAILQYKPVVPLWILMHDSWNPECRSGIADADWAANPHVHSVELDLCPASCRPTRSSGIRSGGLGPRAAPARAPGPPPADRLSPQLPLSTGLSKLGVLPERGQRASEVGSGEVAGSEAQAKTRLAERTSSR